jgi:glycosyltransferase involved in cell wall biosynthesis
MRRIVYVGALDSWFDRGKVEALCRAFPQAQLLLAGPLRMETAWASNYANLRLMGPLAPEEVPALLSRCDVGIIPFVDSGLTRAIHPVKLYEYFAAGLPVVASDLDEIRRIGSPAILARTDSDWVDGVQRAFAAGRRRDYREFAARNDWSIRFARLMEFLEEGRPQTMGAQARMAR